MKIVVNSSPLTFLARLGFLDNALQSFGTVFLPQSVADEIAVKQDEASLAVKAFIDSQRIHVKRPLLTSLVNRLNQRWGREKLLPLF